MTKILAFDPGTNSLGMVCRDTMKDNLMDQIISGVDIIRDNTEKRNGRHSSAASERRSFRNVRTRYRSVKRRKQATLKLLIKHKCCPLDMESLNKWRFDDDEKGYDRTFPVQNDEFMKWINFEFVINREHVKSVYRLREILATTPLDFSKPESWLILGRAIYSIAIRRGFKSSRNANASNNDAENAEHPDLQKSEVELSAGLDKYMHEHDCPTVGAAFSRMERIDKIRIRANSDFKPIRSMLKEEIEKIFEVQKLDTDSDLYKGLISEKKHEGTIFYKNSSKSQKGKVGFCSLEPRKRRCPKSHPANEFNVAWQLLNNIKIKKDGVWKNIELDVRNALFHDLFVTANKYLSFAKIREWLQEKKKIEFEYKVSINYKDNKSIPCCPVIYYLQKILGPSWEKEKIQGIRQHLTHAQRRKKLTNKEDKRSFAEYTNAEGHLTEYTAEDIWHICYESEDKQFVKDFAKNVLGLSKSKVISMGALWEYIQDGYANLSLCALKKINPFLAKGHKYSDAVMLANLPSVMGEAFFEQNEQKIVELLEKEKAKVSDTNRIYDIVNKLISDYKSLKLDDLAFAEHNYDYTLQEDDISDVKKACAKNYEHEWDSLSYDQKSDVVIRVAELYQEFFFSIKRDYYKRINLSDSFKSALVAKYPCLTKRKLRKIYHHSDNSYYPSARKNEEGILQLGSPARGNLRNPTVLKVLYKIKQNVNKLLKNDDIDSDTIVIIENARDGLNDFNMQWAIEEYNDKREKENKTIEETLNELAKQYNLTLPKECVDMARLALYQNENFTPYNPNAPHGFYAKLCDNYKSWLKQGFIDFYTGRKTTIIELFSPNNLVEVDHILPISKSFDDSISNKVLSSSKYNSTIKGTQLPCELSNYLKDTSEGKAIIDRIRGIEKIVCFLESRVDYWKECSSIAADLDSKNYAIKQKHLWQMEYDEWNQRLKNLTATEITQSFRNNQLNDTRTISKYAYHYLKSVFGRVVVQRGQTTAVFRKIFGFQEAYEKKDRSKHTHHAIDALTLSLIPYGRKREEMMDLWYQIQEAHRFKNYDCEQELRRQLEGEVRLCKLGHYSPEEVVRHIEKTTLVKNDSTNHALTKNIKRYRVRGKVVPLRDQEGNVVYEQTAKGKRVKAKYVSKGNSIRGAIHDQSFYGKIEKWKDDTHEKEELFVIRRKIEYKSSDFGSGFKDWNDLEKQMVDKKLFEKLKKQHSGKSFKNACAEGFYTFVIENGVRRKVKVRHVRCIAKKAQPLKKHIFQPQYGVKEQYYYVAPGDAYGIFEYKSEDGKYIYESENLFTLSEKMKNGTLKEMPCPKSIIDKKGVEFVHTRTILKNDTILIFPSGEKAEDQYKLDEITASKRLYRIDSIEHDKRIRLTWHNSVKSSENKKTITDSDFEDLPNGMRATITKLNFILLGTDFDIVNGKIIPLRK